MGKTVDNGGILNLLLTDLSKAFDCIPLYLFITKLEAFGFQTNLLTLFYDYLYRKQRLKINETFSCWKDIDYGVPQGSII